MDIAKKRLRVRSLVERLMWKSRITGGKVLEEVPNILKKLGLKGTPLSSYVCVKGIAFCIKK